MNMLDGIVLTATFTVASAVVRAALTKNHPE
jgi:hypothetical protein